jgi:hypothetical protein
MDTASTLELRCKVQTCPGNHFLINFREFQRTIKKFAFQNLDKKIVTSYFNKTFNIQQLIEAALNFIIEGNKFKPAQTMC